MMKRFALFAAVATTMPAGLAVLDARAGSDRVTWPTEYRQRYVVFGTIDRPDRKPAQVRVLYVNPEAAAASRPDAPAPNGTILVMEDRKARVDAAGNPVKDAQGRFIASDEVVAVAIQEKRAGWGAAYAEPLRNGDWDYASFDPDGKLRANVQTTACLTCHKPRAGTDYTFVYQRWVMDGKPRN
jgi:hypothetical protein